jgi:sec-independent protein translocase protein TatC
MSLVDHLDELRARLVTCLAVFGVALALCFWQNHLLLEIANAPLPKGHEQLLTLGITEPFSTTLTVSAYAAIILALPFVLYELYAFLVLPAAAKFLLNFNDSQFNVQVQAKQYYSFFAMTVLACGIVFQVPVGILAVTRLGIVRVEQLTKNRRYAYLVCAVVAAALPGVDPVSMLLEMAPLVVLYEISIVLAKVFGTPAERVDAAPQGS